jgi:hypothetical protein
VKDAERNLLLEFVADKDKPLVENDEKTEENAGEPDQKKIRLSKQEKKKLQSGKIIKLFIRHHY